MVEVKDLRYMCREVIVCERGKQRREEEKKNELWWW